MFNSNEIKKLKNTLENLSNSNNNEVLRDNAINITAKITATVFDSNTNTYKYTWQGIKTDGSNDTAVGGTDDARCVQEFGKNMTNKSPMAQVNDIVSIERNINGYRFSVVNSVGSIDNLVDLTHTDNFNDTKGWKDGYETNNGTVVGTTLKGVKIRYLTRQHYDSSTDRNYEYYTELNFDDKGVLREAKQVVTVNGFQTTLHT